MKIVVHSLPRSGTKILVKNFQQYLKSLGEPVLNSDYEYGLDEPFSFKEEGWSEEKKTTTRLIIKHLKGETVYVPDCDPEDIKEEIQRRFSALINLKHSWVCRRVPFGKFDPILYDTVSNVDKSIAIIKNNIFDHCLSYTLAAQLKIWSAGQELNLAVEKYTASKIKLNETDFAHHYSMFWQFNQMKWFPPILSVTFEDMVKINNNKEFCDFFQIPFNDFQFSPFEIEFGDNKINMIANIKELKDIANKLDIELQKNIFQK